MNDPLNQLRDQTSEDLFGATSSPGSGSGTTLSTKLGGQKQNQSGPEAAPANRSAGRGAQRDSMTAAISGRTGKGSLLSAELTLSLANRLRLRTDSLGSTLFVLRWKARTTPSGRSISALRASVPPTSDSVFSSWVTPSARDWKDTPGMSTSGMNPDGSERIRNDQLPRQAYLVVSGQTGNGLSSQTGKKGDLYT